MSYKAEVQTSGDPSWSGNAIRLPDEEQAKRYARDLMMRWFAVTDFRVVESDEPVNYEFVDDALQRIE